MTTSTTTGTSPPIDLDAPRIEIRTVAKRTGVDLTTAWRWILKGVRGVKLKSIRVGARRFVLERDLAAFLAELSAPPPPPPPSRRARAAAAKLRHQKAEEECRRLGL